MITFIQASVNHRNRIRLFDSGQVIKIRRLPESDRIRMCFIAENYDDAVADALDQLCLETLGGRKSENIDFKKLKLKTGSKISTGSETVLIQAFYAAEGAEAIPADQIILYPNQKISALMLPKGKFRIRAIDRTGRIIGEYIK
jgi:hypothetical protein